VLDVRYINLSERVGRRRAIELQLRLHRIPATRVEALTPERARAVVTDSRLELGELGLNATWIQLLRSVLERPADHTPEWLVVLEDDTVLVPRFGRRLLDTLAAAPPECAFLQLAHLDRYSWRSHRPTRANLRTKAAMVVRRTAALPRRPSRTRAPLFGTDLRAGSHVCAVRSAHAQLLVDLLIEQDIITDDAFLAGAAAHPGRFLRYRGQLGYQLPFASDIADARHRRRLRSGPAGPADGPST
jgi:hypothetical protein